MKTAVVILNWNGVKHLQTYLPSVIEFSSNEHVEIWVVDNGSTDDSCSWIEINHPSIKLVKLDKNYGFAGGYNLGIDKITADRYILLNSDVRVTDGWIELTSETMRKLSLSACAPLVLSDQHPNLFDYAGAAGGFIDKDGFVFCAGRMFNRFESDDNYCVDKEVFWASGAALFVEADIWAEIGGLDEDLFAHMEEIDLCWRLKNRGYKVGVCGKARVYHLGGGTLATSSPFKVFLNFRNNLTILLKNKKGFWPFFIFRRMLLDGVAATRFLFRFELSFLLSVIQAHFAFCLRLMPTLKMRKKEIKAIARTGGNSTGYYTKSVIIQFFFFGVKKFSELKQRDFI